FMRDRWVPLLTTTAAPEPVDERPLGGFVQGVTTFLLNTAEPVKLAVYTSPFIILAALFYSLYEDARHELYIAGMNLAQRAYQEGNLPRLGQLVDDQRPAWLRRDYRSFEWYFYRKVCAIGP